MCSSLITFPFSRVNEGTKIQILAPVIRGKKGEYVKLLQAKLKLDILECDGVDNWEWYMEGADEDDWVLLDNKSKILEVYGVHEELNIEFINSKITEIQNDINKHYMNKISDKDTDELLYKIFDGVEELRVKEEVEDE